MKVQPVRMTDEKLDPGVSAGRTWPGPGGALTTAVELGTVQPAGKKAMAAADWARGLHGDPLVFV